MLGGKLAVLQAPLFDGLSLDPFALLDDGCRPAEVGVGGRHVAQALVITLARCAGYLSSLVLPTLCPARIFVSSSRLDQLR